MSIIIRMLILTVLLTSCKKTKINEIDSQGEVVIEQLSGIKEIYLKAPKIQSTVSVVIKINGVLKNDTFFRLYTKDDNVLKIEQKFDKGSYSYSREYRMDYYLAKDLLLKIETMPNSNESFSFIWAIV